MARPDFMMTTADIHTLMMNINSCKDMMQEAGWTVVPICEENILVERPIVGTNLLEEYPSRETNGRYQPVGRIF